MDSLAQQLRPRGNNSVLRLANYEGALTNRPPSLAKRGTDALDMEQWNWQYFQACLVSEPKTLNASCPQWNTISGNYFPSVSQKTAKESERGSNPGKKYLSDSLPATVGWARFGPRLRNLNTRSETPPELAHRPAGAQFCSTPVHPFDVPLSPESSAT